MNAFNSSWSASNSIRSREHGRNTCLFKRFFTNNSQIDPLNFSFLSNLNALFYCTNMFVAKIREVYISRYVNR